MSTSPKARNLRAAFFPMPAEAQLPTNADEVAQHTWSMLVHSVLKGESAPVSMVRYADDGVSSWLMDDLEGIAFEDLIRAVVRFAEPHAYAFAVVQLLREVASERVVGLDCRACFGDEFVMLRGMLEGMDGPVQQRRVVGLKRLTRTVTADADRWIGVPPTVHIHLPFLDAGDA